MSDAKQPPKPVTTMELTTKPEKNFAAMVQYKAGEIMAVAAANVRLDPNWLARAQMELFAKPETAIVMLKAQGVESVLKALKKAATAGISFGGIRPQAYFTPSDGNSTVRLDVSQFGYAHAAVYGPGGVLSQVPELITVHQNDGTRMDQSTGEIIFPKGGIDPFKDRGKLVGWMMRLVYKDARQPEVKYITIEAVHKIQEGHSTMGSPAMKKDREQMDEKTAVKQMLKWAFGESEGRAQNVLDALDAEDRYDEPPVVVRDQGDRLSQSMAKATEGMKSAEPVQTIEDASEPEVEDEEPPATAATEEKTDKDELF